MDPAPIAVRFDLLATAIVEQLDIVVVEVGETAEENSAASSLELAVAGAAWERSKVHTWPAERVAFRTEAVQYLAIDRWAS
jgi:hypothetical protein